MNPIAVPASDHAPRPLLACACTRAHTRAHRSHIHTRISLSLNGVPHFARSSRYPLSGFETVQGRRWNMEDAHIHLDDVRTEYPSYKLDARLSWCVFFWFVFVFPFV